MLSYLTYKVAHLLGVLLLFTSLGGLCGLGSSDGGSGTRKLAQLAHGIGLLLILFSGFGLLAKLGLTSAVPLWVWLKLVIWLVLGGAVALIRRLRSLAPALLLLLPLLGAVAAYLVIHRVSL